MGTSLEQIVTQRISQFYKDLPSTDKRRALARGLLAPDIEIPLYNELKQVRYQLSALWALPKHDERVRQAGHHLWQILPMVNEHPGELAAVIHTEEAGRQTGSFINGSVGLTVGRLPADPDTLNHWFRGRLTNRGHEPNTAIRAPYIAGKATIPLLVSQTIESDGYTYTATQPAAEATDIIVFEAVAHLGDDESYAARTATVTVNRLLVGNEPVKTYMRKLAATVLQDMQPIVDDLATAAQMSDLSR